MATRVTSPILIGRADELAQLTSALESAAAGRQLTVLLGGEAGIGKTRLVSELAALARERGALVLEGACISLGDDEFLPLAPVADALRSMIRQLEPAAVAEAVGPFHAALARLVPELGTPEAAAELAARPDWAQGRLLEAVAGLLERLAETRPVVVLVEDIHWADRSTRDVLAYLARAGRGRLLVVATVRSDELHRRHPLRPWLAEMERLPRVRRIDLSRLGRDDLGRMLAAIRGVEATPTLVDTVARRSDGNPFFAEELLAAGATGPDDRLPDDLREVLLTRITALSDESQRVLGVAAVGGRVVDHETWAAVAGSEEVVEGAVREAAAAGLVVVDVDAAATTYAFRHALLQEAVEGDLLPTERRRLHAAYARVLEARPVPEGAAGASHLAALAHHAMAAHESPLALRSWLAAARASLAAGAFAGAARAYERALDLWDAVPADDRPSGEEPIRILYDASLAHIVAGEPARAAALAKQAVGLVDESSDPIRAAKIRERYARASWVAGDFDTGMREYRAAYRLVQGAEPSRAVARVIGGLAQGLMLRGNHREAVRIGEEAAAVARLSEAPGALAHILATVGTSLVLLGEGERGLALVRESFEMTRELDLVHDLGRAYSNLSSVLSVLGRNAEAAEVAREGAAWSRRHGTYRTYGVFHEGNLASALLALGEWQEARTILEPIEAIEIEGVVRLAFLTNYATLLVRLGELERARPFAAEAVDRARVMGDVQFTAPALGSLAELELAAGHAEAAWALAREGTARVEDRDDVVPLAYLSWLAVQAAADLAAIARARRTPFAAAKTTAEAGAILRRLRRIYRGLAADNPAFAAGFAMLESAHAEARRMAGRADPGAWAKAAAQWSSLDSPYPLAYVRFRESEAMLEAGDDRATAGSHLAEAAAIARRLGARRLLDDIEALARRARLELAAEHPAGDGLGAARRPVAEAGVLGGAGAETAEASPPEPQPAADPFGLTDREHEVLRLLAQGLTNRRIGENLFISESTAGVHVSNILGKLGVSSRTEAAAVAVRLGLAE